MELVTEKGEEDKPLYQPSDAVSKGNDINVKQLRTLKVFRIFRVFRIAKVLRRIKAMRNIINGIFKSLNNIISTIALLFLFIIIFILLGRSLLTTIPDFNDFLSTFYIVFQILTLENWNVLLYNHYKYKFFLIILAIILL
jgi:hypothetical protein